MTSALICIDFINEIVDARGKLAGKGYAAFADLRQTLEHVADAQKRFRELGRPVIHVRVSFGVNYIDHPSESPLFGKAKQFGALQGGTWGTAFASKSAPLESEYVITKPRVSAFYGTSLDAVLRSQNVREVYIAGVATDLAVEAAARDAHDRDYIVTVLADCCAAASEEDHARSLGLLAKIARVAELAAIAPS